jgi:hypothetical protein
MIDKRINFQYGGGADMGGVADSQGNTGPGTGGLGDRGGGGSNRDRGMGIHGKTSTIGKTTTAQQDANQRAQVRAGRVRGLEQFIDRPTLGFTDAARINLFNPRNIFSGIMGLINPALGLATRGLGYLGDKFQGLRGYNPDGTPRTQEEYELAMRDKQIQSRIDNIMNRQTLGKSFSQTNLDSLLGMTDMYGDRFSPSTAQNVLTGRDLKGFTPSRMGIMNPDVRPTQMFNFDPTQFNTRNRDLGELVAEITNKDREMMQTPVGQMMDYDTFKAISGNETLTPQEFEQLRNEVI